MVHLYKPMDFLDPKKKRANTIRLYLGYLLVGIAIAIGSYIIYYQSYGYGYNTKTREVIQNGLVFVSARPEAADIYLNGQTK